MSNCDLVAARSLIALPAPRLALRAPALRAAAALTRPNRSAQRLSCGRQAVSTAVAIDPIDVEHCAIREYLRNPSLLMRLVPRQLFGYGRSDRSSKLTHGFGSKAAAGFRPRRGRCCEPTPVISQYTLFTSYKAPRLHHVARRHSRGLADRCSSVGVRTGFSSRGGKHVARTDIRPPRSGPRHSRFPSGPGETEWWHRVHRTASLNNLRPPDLRRV